MIQIPLQGTAANAHQRFSVQLGNKFLEFRLNYLTRFDSWVLDVYQDDSLLIAGAMLEPNAHITASTGTDIGSLYFYGEQSTLDNLGITNFLVWVDD